MSPRLRLGSVAPVLLAALLAPVVLGGCDNGGAASAPNPSVAPATQSPAETEGPDLSFLSLSVEDQVSAIQNDVSIMYAAHTKTVEFDGDQRVRLDIRLNDSGMCEGTVDAGRAGSLELLHTEGRYLIRPDEAFWRARAGGQADALVAHYGDKWIEAPQSLDIPWQLYCEFAWVFPGVGSLDPDDVRVGGVRIINGIDTVAVATGSYNMWIRLEEPHYPVLIQRKDDSRQTMNVSQFDKPFIVTLPPESRIVAWDQ